MTLNIQWENVEAQLDWWLIQLLWADDVRTLTLIPSPDLVPREAGAGRSVGWDELQKGLFIPLYGPVKKMSVCIL